MTEKIQLLALDKAGLSDICKDVDVSTTHADKLIKKIFRNAGFDFENIPDFPVKLATWLKENTDHSLPEIVKVQESEDGTKKLLMRLKDGRDVESVLIPAAGRMTQCISTQVGCAMGCEFCLTATAGLTRDLTVPEMVGQIMVAHNILGEYPRNLVLMGMGEPLHNYENVASFIRTVTNPQGMAFAPRRVTISTSGLVPAMYQLLEDDLSCSLAISLNATTDEVRDKIMPINKKYPLAELLKAMKAYVAARNRKRVLIEYVLLAGINDTPDDAKRLVKIAKDIDSTVNILPFNPFPGSPFSRPDDEVVDMFRNHLNDAGVVAVIRVSKGREISAACGQLKTEVNQRTAQLKEKRSARL